MSKVRNAEDELILRIRRRMPSAWGASLRFGIGDDAAVIRPRQGNEWVLTCDQFLEDVHFLRDVYPPEAIGYKALARATSDIAAMGAKPSFFLMSICLPAGLAGSWLDGMAKGMARAARQFGLTLAGGDTAQSPPPNPRIGLDLTVVGETGHARAVGRTGAKPGDAIFVSGSLGDSQLGLELIRRGLSGNKRWRKLVQPHFYPEIDVELGRRLAERQLASAMMDISDGLSTDLYRLCAASHVGARIYEDKLPSVAISSDLAVMGLEARSLALHGGEDYGLLFTVRKRHIPVLQRVFRDRRITRIGEIVPGSEVRVIAGGKSSSLEPLGWDHFRKSN